MPITIEKSALLLVEGKQIIEIGGKDKLKL